MLPFLLVDTNKCKDHIEKMHLKSKQSEVLFRPHFKTHQSADIASYFRKSGVTRIAVSSLSMAQYFMANGWTDILLSLIANPNDYQQINKISSEINFQILVDSVYTSKKLAAYIHTQTPVYIKIDCGYGRSGVPADQIEEIEGILNALQGSKLPFKGFLAHFGDTYQAKNQKDIMSIYEKSVNKLKKLKSAFITTYPNLILSIGDTPSCSLVDDFSDVDEIRPGNFVFYDVMQSQLQSCSPNDIAVALIAPVISKQASKNQLIIHGGAVHLSKEYLLNDQGEKIYGLVANYKNASWGKNIDGAYLSSLSQEHGIIQMPASEMEKYNEGDLLAILPVHSCLTANLATCYLSTEGSKLEKMP
jgi:D-serine deaminase-like pyridoxal phosphate-dependent protein